jgi:hypothetical protein
MPAVELKVLHPSRNPFYVNRRGEWGRVNMKTATKSMYGIDLTPAKVPLSYATLRVPLLVFTV